MGAAGDPCFILPSYPYGTETPDGSCNPPAGMLQQIVGGISSPQTFPPPPPPPAPLGPPATYDPATGQCLANCGSPLPTSMEAVYQNSLKPITGTPCDPSANLMCRWFSIGCPNGVPAGCTSAFPSWFIWVGLGLGLLLMEGR